MSAILTAYITL